MDNVGADEPDSFTVSDDANVHLKQLCSRLHRDLKHILLLSTTDCQVLIASQSFTAQKMNFSSSSAFNTRRQHSAI